MFSLLVREPERAKEIKPRLISARALRVELIVRLDGYGGTGRACSIGAPQDTRKSEELAYEARLVAVRLADANGRLTPWTKASEPAATLIP